MEQLPIVCLSQWTDSGDDDHQRQALAAQVRDICHSTGFFLLQQHGLESILDRLFDLSRQFFALPVETKQRIDKARSPHFRGWEAVGTEFTNGRPDVREQVDLWTPHEVVTNVDGDNGDKPKYLRLLGRNQWFNDDENINNNAILPEWEALTTQWFVEAQRVADMLLEILAVGLGLPANYFATNVFGVNTQRMSLTKLIRYPPTPAGHAGVNAHHDTGFLTLLACQTTPGLQVLIDDTTDTWLPVTPPTKDTLVVNLGEMLQAMTGNYYVATPHRVICSSSGERFAIGYFHGPSLDTPLTPALPLDASYQEAVRNSRRHAEAGFMARREEINPEEGVGDMKSTYRASTYGEQLWNYFVRSYPQHVQRHYPQDFLKEKDKEQ